MAKDSSKSMDEKDEKEVVDANVEQETAATEKTAAENQEVKDEAEEAATEPVQEVTEEEKLAKQVAEMNDKYLRLSAEFDNYRKRTLKEKMELTKSAGESILLGLLPVADDFDRALNHIDDVKDVESMKEGIMIIYKKFADFLQSKGVKEIDSIQKEFDTDLHEAITKIPAPTEELKGKVIDCIEKGYTLNEKVIRFSKVVVGE